MCDQSFKSTLTRTKLPSSPSRIVRTAKRFLCALDRLLVCHVVVLLNYCLCTMYWCHGVLLASVTDYQ